MSHLSAQLFRLQGVADGRCRGRAYFVLQLRRPDEDESEPLTVALPAADARALLLSLAVLVPELPREHDPLRN